MRHLIAGRVQMGTSLAFHLGFAVLGVGLPVMMLTAQGLHLRTGDPVWLALARRWSKAFAILFAVGAVSGTIISCELGFTRIAGGIIGLPTVAALLAPVQLGVGDLLAGVTLIARGVRAGHVGHQHTQPTPRPRPRG